MLKKTISVKELLVKFLIVTLIFLATSCLSGCLKNVRPPLSVCTVRIDWSDEALDNLSDHNKICVLTLSDYCEEVEDAREEL